MRTVLFLCGFFVVVMCDFIIYVSMLKKYEVAKERHACQHVTQCTTEHNLLDMHLENYKNITGLCNS